MLKTLAVLLCMAVSAAWAQSVEVGIQGGYPRWGRAPLGSVSPELVQDTDTQFKGDYGYGASVTLNTKGYYGFELGYLRDVQRLTTVTRQTVDTTVYTTNYEDRLPVHIAYFDAVVYFMPRGERWRPFVNGGLQAYQYQNPHLAVWTGSSLRHYGANFGGGVKLKLFSHALLRWDLRDYMGGKPYHLAFATASRQGGHIHLIEGTMGFAITF